MAQLLFLQSSVAIAPSVEYDANVARTLTDADNGKTIIFTAAAAVTVTVPVLSVAVSVELVQGDALGPVSLLADGTTLNVAPTFLTTTNELWSPMVVTMTSGTDVLVRGDLATV